MPGRRRQRRTERSKLDATPPWEQRDREEPTATEGPYDERDEPGDGRERVDLGAIRVPVVDGLDLRVDVSEGQQITAVNLAGADGHMQLGVFAAPRNEGIWDEVRTEISASIKEQKGSAQEQPDGPFGIELVGRLPGDGTPGGAVPVRFIGVDGPRWFLRAMLVGPVAADPAKAESMLDALRQVIVVRGSEPLPAREPVPLRLPKEMAASIEEAIRQQS